MSEPRSNAHPNLRVLGFGLAASVPFWVAIVALHGRPWFPTGDLAQAEMRVRDVWSHLPLVGAAGRISTGSIQGSHPGPLMFWAAWPVYVLLGKSPWALEAAYAVLNIGWVVAIAFAARRRGGTPLLLAILGVTSLLVQSYGLSALTQPWNPYAPLLPFLLLLLLVWGVLCDDIAQLPLAVAVGSYCIQCHVSYAAVVGALLAVCIGWQLFERYRERDAQSNRRLARWVGMGVVAGVLAWTAPVWQQLTQNPGNFWIIYRYFRFPGEQAIGGVHGAHLTLLQLNPWGSWLTGRWVTTGSIAPGVVLLAAWACGAIATWRDDGRLRRLHVVLLVALLVAVASAARIFGEVWGYLVEWMWSITALLIVDIFWATYLIVGRYRPALPRRVVIALPAGVLLVGMAFGAVDGATMSVPSQRISDQERVISAETIEHIDPTKRYLVDWQDPIGLGGTGFGLMLEMERHGIDVGTLPMYRTGVRDHRVKQPGSYDTVLHVVTGYYALLWRHDPKGVEVACVDLRTPDERAESQQLERDLIHDLEARGDRSAASQVATNLFAVFFDPATPPVDAAKAFRIMNLMETVTVVAVPAHDSRLSKQAIAEVEALPQNEKLGAGVTC